MERIDKTKLPQHIAIIMDGNGRWAEINSVSRIDGHRRGADSVRAIVRTCREIGIKYLTLYAFSVENWLRPAREVRALMNLLETFLRSELQEMLDNDVKLMTIGNTEMLPGMVKKVLQETIEKTSDNKGMILNLALSYGGRDEIVEAVKKILKDSEAGNIAYVDISKEIFSGYLYTSGVPDPDLLVRTGEEYRLSNFLLWQMAYTEFYFTDVLWPDFRRENLIEAIADYQKRERRFGRTSDQLL
ncbi:MAG: isoprenyl transferase [Thermodesulfobacteriota bacterium]|nr:isoprenyl transferase [Thermodesulfobacteriota bacterium]